jgi:predicted nucleic acid-binding protein
VACEVVWAEVTAAFKSRARANEVLDALGVEFSPIHAFAAADAGAIWREYRTRGGKRARIIPDFLIGSHAAHRADRLLTRDRGFYGSRFSGLEVIDPSKRRAR